MAWKSGHDSLNNEIPRGITATIGAEIFKAYCGIAGNILWKQ